MCDLDKAVMNCLVSPRVYAHANWLATYMDARAEGCISPYTDGKAESYMHAWLTSVPTV